MLQKIYVFKSKVLLARKIKLFLCSLLWGIGIAFFIWTRFDGEIRFWGLSLLLVVELFWYCFFAWFLFVSNPPKIVVCREYLQLNREQYRWMTINDICLAWLKFEKGAKYPVLLLELLRPVGRSYLHFKDPDKLAPMNLANVQEYVLDCFPEQQYPEIINAIALYKRVGPTIEVEAYVD